MDDDMILERGGDEEDIRRYAEANGADLTEADLIEDEEYRKQLEYSGPEYEDGPWAPGWKERGGV